MQVCVCMYVYAYMRARVRAFEYVQVCNGQSLVLPLNGNFERSAGRSNFVDIHVLAGIIIMMQPRFQQNKRMVKLRVQQIKHSGFNRTNIVTASTDRHRGFNRANVWLQHTVSINQTQWFQPNKHMVSAD